MVSIIIPSYNSEQTIEKCLRSLKNQNYRSEYEIILVDSSNDETPRIVKEKFSEVTLIHKNNRTDPGTARNLGITKAQGDLIIFLDADCIPASDWLEKHVNAHRQQYIAVGGAIHNSKESQNAVGYAGYISEFREFIPERSRAEVAHVPTCNISYKKEVFEKYGQFRGEYYPQEDLVFNYHLARSGEKILFDPSIIVYHIHRSDFKAFMQHQKKIGRITAQVLEQFKLKGRFLVRHRIIAFPLILCLPIIKFCRTLLVFLKYKPGIFFIKPCAVILFGLGLLIWEIGFVSYIFNFGKE